MERRIEISLTAFRRRSRPQIYTDETQIVYRRTRICLGQTEPRITRISRMTNKMLHYQIWFARTRPRRRTPKAMLQAFDLCSPCRLVTSELQRDGSLANWREAARNSALVTRLVLDILRPSMFAPSVTGRVGVNAQRPQARARNHRSPNINHSVRAKQRDPESIRGFTLLELLIVVGIIAPCLC